MRQAEALEAQTLSLQGQEAIAQMNPESFAEISVIWASHRTDSINALIKSLNQIGGIGLIPTLRQFASEDVLGIDPELVRSPFRDAETQSDSPVIPAVEKIYKILRFYGYIFDPAGSPDQNEVDAEMAEMNLLEGYVKDHQGPMGLENVQDIKRLIAPFLIRSLVKEKTILSSDVLFSLDDEIIHRQIRSPEEVQKMPVNELALYIEGLTKKVLDMYAQSRIAKWTVSYAGYKKNSIRHSKPMIIEAKVPALKNLLQQDPDKFLALRTSPGIRLIEILRELNIQFTIRNTDQPEQEAIPITGEVAEQLVVAKIPLPGMISQLLTERDWGRSIPEVPDRLVKEISLALPWIFGRAPIRPYRRKKQLSA